MDDFPFNDTPSLLKEIERLKGAERDAWKHYAAEVIKSLRAEVERLRAERDKADAKAHTWSQRCLVFEAKIQRLEAALLQCLHESGAAYAEIPIRRIVENALDLKHEVDDE